MPFVVVFSVSQQLRVWRVYLWFVFWSYFDPSAHGKSTALSSSVRIIRHHHTSRSHPLLHTSLECLMCSWVYGSIWIMPPLFGWSRFIKGVIQVLRHQLLDHFWPPSLPLVINVAGFAVYCNNGRNRCATPSPLRLDNVILARPQRRLRRVVHIRLQISGSIESFVRVTSNDRWIRGTPISHHCQLYLNLLSIETPSSRVYAKAIFSRFHWTTVDIEKTRSS